MGWECPLCGAFASPSTTSQTTGGAGSRSSSSRITARGRKLRRCLKKDRLQPVEGAKYRRRLAVIIQQTAQALPPLDPSSRVHCSLHRNDQSIVEALMLSFMMISKDLSRGRRTPALQPPLGGGALCSSARGRARCPRDFPSLRLSSSCFRQ